MIRVLVLRDRSFAGLLSAMAIEIDGIPVAKVRRDGRATFEVPRSDHVMTVRMKFTRSGPVEVASDGGDSLRFACGCRGYGESMHVRPREVGFEHHHFNCLRAEGAIFGGIHHRLRRLVVPCRWIRPVSDPNAVVACHSYGARRRWSVDCDVAI